ncbi:unnamed protein product, partial [Didymodactylos carnosus]
DSDIEIHTRNISEAKAVKVVKSSAVSNGIAFGTTFRVSENVSVYRRMCEDEVNSVINSSALDARQKYKWVTESLNKALKFQNNAMPAPVGELEKILKTNVNKEFYRDFRKELILQFICSQRTKSVFHHDGIKSGRF